MPTGPLPPAPPPSPSRHRIKQGGLVSGTGRLKHVKRRQIQQPQPEPEPEQPQQPQQQPLTPREQFAKYYGFTLPPPPPPPPPSSDSDPYEYHPRFPIANSASSSSTASSSSSSWNSSSSYNPAAHPVYCPTPPAPPFKRSSSCRTSTSLPTYPSPLEHDELLAKFNDQFIHSRTMSSTTNTPEPPKTPTKRERSILPPGAEGKLLAPNVKLKVRCSSSASLESAPSRRSSSSKKSPLSAPCNVREFDQPEPFTSFTLKRPTFESRCLSLPFLYFSLMDYFSSIVVIR